jgi:hypothetical protein
MIRRIAICLAALAMGTWVAAADDGHNHVEGDNHEQAHDHGSKRGGVVEHSGHHVLELVAKGGALELYITNEDGKEEDASAAKATATVLADGKTEQVTLAPAGGNTLKGTGSFNAGKGTTIMLSLTMPDHEPEQVRFKLD